jgi:hypothetical protein
MVETASPRFSLGRVLATPAALQVLEAAGRTPADYLDRHLNGDWGDLPAGDRQLNDEALGNGSRIFSAYVVDNNQKIWIITEAVGEHGQRASTTILLPSEY